METSERGRDHTEHAATAAEALDHEPTPHSLPQHHPRAHSEAEAAFASSSHGIRITFPDVHGDASRPQLVKVMSAPTYHSPIRHHQRAPSKSKGVKETLNAKSSYGSSDDEGTSFHRINQYIIKQEIGRGSFGAVHLAVDQFGQEYAVKEFSKARLRKRAQSSLLRKPNRGAARRPGHLAAGVGFNSPLHRLSSGDRLERLDTASALDLIREEIAIMKKLNHNNLVALYEVLDDPQEDSLYMVLDYCKKGVVMKVGLDERAEPYESEACRCWFRDMILGIEYLHHQGIIHRDIKPDNCLITEDDVLKIVDFGVSEMFEKESDMATAKSAGSPAFMPPELCVARHGQVSGRAADIWSMGVTLYCLRYGHIPFEKANMLELYESIRNDELVLDDEQDPDFEDLIRRMLEKNPDRRITMEQIREHPWVTKGGEDCLLSADENCADLIEPPTEAEKNHAITGNMGNLLTVMRAVQRFKMLLHRKRPGTVEGIFGRDSKFVSPPTAMDARGQESRSIDTHDRRPMDKILVTAGVHRDVEVDNENTRVPHTIDKMHAEPATVDVGDDQASHSPGVETEAVQKQRVETLTHQPPHQDSHQGAHRGQSAAEFSARDDGPDNAEAYRTFTFPTSDHAKGHAHNPLNDTLFLSVGPGSFSDPSTNFQADPSLDGDVDPLNPVVSESPPEVEGNFYERAYQEELTRILERRRAAEGNEGNSNKLSIYLTRRVDHREDLRNHESIHNNHGPVVSGDEKRRKLLGAVSGGSGGGGGGGGGLAALVKQAREKQQQEDNGHQGVSGVETNAASDAGEVNTETSSVPLEPLDAAHGTMPGMPGAFPQEIAHDDSNAT